MQVGSGSNVPRTTHAAGLEHGPAEGWTSPGEAEVEVLRHWEDDTEN
jgi:hypothetical protein